MSKRRVDSGVGAVESGEGREWRWVQVGRGGLPPSVAREEAWRRERLPVSVGDHRPPTHRGSTQQSAPTVQDPNLNLDQLLIVTSHFEPSNTCIQASLVENSFVCAKSGKTNLGRKDP